MFAEEYHDLVEETKVTSGDAGFHSENAMQEIGGALDHLTLEADTNKDIVIKLTEAIEALTRNNASLTTQFSDALNTNLDKQSLLWKQWKKLTISIMTRRENSP